MSANKDNIRFMYMRDWDTNFPHTCVAIRVNDMGNVEYQLSTYNVDAPSALALRIELITNLGGIVPQSMRNELKASKIFSKKIARKIALGRLEIKPIAIVPSSTNHLSCHEISRLVMNSIMIDEDVADRASTYAYHWVKDNEARFPKQQNLNSQAV